MRLRLCALLIAGAVAGLVVGPATAYAFTWRDALPSYSGGVGGDSYQWLGGGTNLIFGYKPEGRIEASNTWEAGFAGQFPMCNIAAPGQTMTFTYDHFAPAAGEYALVMFMEDWSMVDIKEASGGWKNFRFGLSVDQSPQGLGSMTAPNAVVPGIDNHVKVGGGFNALERDGKYPEGVSTNLPVQGYMEAPALLLKRGSVIAFARVYRDGEWKWRSWQDDSIMSYHGSASAAAAIAEGTGMGTVPTGVTSGYTPVRVTVIKGVASAAYTSFATDPEDYPKWPGSAKFDTAGGYYGGETSDPAEVARVYDGIPTATLKSIGSLGNYPETWTVEPTSSVDPTATVNPTDDPSSDWILNLIPEPYRSWLRSWAGSIANLTNRFRSAWWFLDPWGRFDEQRQG